MVRHDDELIQCRILVMVWNSYPGLMRDLPNLVSPHVAVFDLAKALNP
jgi:hypothetical protein